MPESLGRTASTSADFHSLRGFTQPSHDSDESRIAGSDYGIPGDTVDAEFLELSKGEKYLRLYEVH